MAFFATFAFLISLASLWFFTPTSINAQDSDGTCTVGGGEGIETAIGCIGVEYPSSFVGTIMRFAIGIAGGIAFLLMIVGVFLILTSSGNPEKNINDPNYI